MQSEKVHILEYSAYFQSRILKDNSNDITLSLDICNNSNLHSYEVDFMETVRNTFTGSSSDNLCILNV